MAWNESYGTRSYRKEMESHRRANCERQAITPRERTDRNRKRGRCDSRKFALEFKARKPVPSGSFFSNYNDWQRYWSKYETEKQRDQALEQLNRRGDHFEYRPLNL
jgi:hypothetical protein